MIVVFAGPTLPAADIVARLPCAVLPPAGQGDVYRAVRRHRPVAIGLIDGVFRGRRAVWHREILWAMSQGVHVLGAASMGALRAVELEPFGMRGVGRIVTAYRAGCWPECEDVFEDDDEVAVEHAPAELGHAPLSTAMVDLRDTLLAAEAAGVLDRAERLRLTASCKLTHYSKRSLAALEHQAQKSLERYQVGRKRLDALEMLEALSMLDGADPFQPNFRFQMTTIWNHFVVEAERAGHDPVVAAVLDELRLDPAAWRSTCLAAHGRAASRPQPVGDMPEALSHFRAARGLGRRLDLDAWMKANAIDEGGLRQLLRTAPDSTAPSPPAEIMADELRASGRFAGLFAAVQEKARVTEATTNGIDYDGALDWYFANLPEGRPESLKAFWQELGWRDLATFRRAVLDACRAAHSAAPRRWRQ